MRDTTTVLLGHLEPIFHSPLLYMTIIFVVILVVSVLSLINHGGIVAILGLSIFTPLTLILLSGVSGEYNVHSEVSQRAIEDQLHEKYGAEQIAGGILPTGRSLNGSIEITDNSKNYYSVQSLKIDGKTYNNCIATYTDFKEPGGWIFTKGGDITAQMKLTCNSSQNSDKDIVMKPKA